MWIARDENGRLYAYGSKPIKLKTEFSCESYIEDDYDYENFDYDDWCELNPKEFPEVAWENSPVEIKSLKGIEKDDKERIRRNTSISS
ncbi:MAG: hypothetical protein IJ759_00110 [Bacteroidales bacterium]|nr:hypothetical protein [Bacteroidales bacterium]